MTSELDLQRYINLILKHKKLFLIVALSIMTMAVLLSYLLPKKYEASSTVFIEKNVISDLVKGIAVTPSMEDSIKVITYAINSRTMVLKVLNELDINLKTKNDAQLETLVRDLQKSTEIKLTDNNLFIISFKHENPRFARDYVNTLIRIYIEENVSSKRGESYGATKFLSEQIDTFKEKMEKAEAEVNKFKNKKGGEINIDEGRLLTEINNAQQKLYDLQLRRRILEGQQRVTKKYADPLKANLLAQQKKLDELRVAFTDEYPEVIKVKNDIEVLKEQIKARKDSDFSYASDPQDEFKNAEELNAIKSIEQSLLHHIAMNQNLLNNAPTTKSALEKLEFEKNNQKMFYDQLVARHGQSEVSKQMELQDKSTTFRIVDPAVTPVKPVSPNRIRIILIGIAAGLAGGLGILLLLDYFDNSIKMADALKPLGFPVLAVVPMIKNEDAIRVERKKDMKLYYLCGSWFSIILMVLVMESLGATLMDTLVSNSFLPRLAAKITEWF